MQILSVDEVGGGIKAIRPQSIMDMMKVGPSTKTQWPCSDLAKGFGIPVVTFCCCPSLSPACCVCGCQTVNSRKPEVLP